MYKYRIIKLILALVMIVCGNSFLIIFVNDLGAQRLLSTSPLDITGSLFYSILFLSLFFSSSLFFSIFEEEHLYWLLVSILSLSAYPFIVDKNIFNVLGQLAIALSIYAFLISFHRMDVSINSRSSVMTKLLVSLSGVTLIASFIITVTFYNIYKTALTNNNSIISDSVTSKSLQSVLRVYLDDLKIYNLNEKFGDYLVRRSNETGMSKEEVRSQVLFKLGFSSAEESESMENLLTNSLKDSILRFITQYKKQMPIIISLSLGLVTQVLIMLSEFLSVLTITALFKLFLKLKLIKIIKRQGDFSSVLSSEFSKDV